MQQHPEHAQPAVFADQRTRCRCVRASSFPARPCLYVREQLKLETTRIRVVARTSEKKSHVAFREVKVTLGGCGG